MLFKMLYHDKGCQAVKHLEPVFEQKEDKRWTEEVSGYVKVYTKGSEHRVIHVKIIKNYLDLCDFNIKDVRFLFC